MLRPTSLLSHPLKGLAIAAILSCSLPAADPLHSTEQLAVTWAKLRDENARLLADWRWEKDVLAASEIALQARAEQLRERRDLLKQKYGAESREIGDLKQRADEGRLAVEEVDTRLQASAARVLALRKSLPPRLSQALDLSFRTLADPGVPVAERAQALTTVLNRCALFNHGIHVSEEILQLPGSKEARMLEVIYWGLSHGYALDRQHRRAFVGQSTADGWIWQPADGIAAQVAAAIDVRQGKDDPRFVMLPVQLTNPAFAAPQSP